MNLVALDKIVIDSTIQLRQRHVDSHTVGAYVEAISAGAEFPAIVIYDDGERFWLADGFHRISAYRFLNRLEILADVRQGTRQDALIFAATANVTNGRPMNQAEKREAGERLIKLTDWSDKEIARQLAVHWTTVNKWRLSLEISNDTRTVTRNGTTYQMQTNGIGKTTNGINKTVTPQIADTAQIPLDTRPLFADDPHLDAALADESRPVCLECGQVYDGASCPDCKTIESLPNSVTLICGDFAQVAQDLSSESIDIIITDPPYPREFIELYGLLAEQAARLLKPGGSLLAMCGQSYLPEILSMMTPHLTYHWTISYQTPGGQSPQIWPRKVNTFWKPVLWFIKGEYSGVWHGDVIKSDVNDKRFHHWGQSESGMARLINDYSIPGDLVLDPFCGGGTTGVVSVALKRRFVGIDIDTEAIRVTQDRLLEVVNGG